MRIEFEERKPCSHIVWAVVFDTPRLSDSIDTLNLTLSENQILHRLFASIK
jgi:hypothetical protein